MSRIKYQFQFNIILVLVFLSSCATILNGTKQKIVFSTDRKIKIVSVQMDAKEDPILNQSDLGKEYHVERSNKPLKVILQIDSTQKSIYIEPKKSLAYWSNIYFDYGIGMLVDNNNIKKWGYQCRNYLTAKDSTIRISRFAPMKKGTVMLSLALPIPFTNIFNLKTIKGKYQSIGVFGFQGGMDYFYRDNHFLSINLGAATDVFAEHIGNGYFETGSTVFTSIKNNQVAGSFSFGYGVNLSQFKWTNQLNGDRIKVVQSLKNLALGPSLSVDYRLGNYLRLGFLYQPTIINTTLKPVFDYQHYISINLTWKIPIKKMGD